MSFHFVYMFVLFVCGALGLGFLSSLPLRLPQLVCYKYTYSFRQVFCSTLPYIMCSVHEYLTHCPSSQGWTLGVLWCWHVYTAWLWCIGSGFSCFFSTTASATLRAIHMYFQVLLKVTLVCITSIIAVSSSLWLRTTPTMLYVRK